MRAVPRARLRGEEAIAVGVFSHLFAAVAEEMGAVLEHGSFSANIKERRDFSCALFDARGEMIAQAAHIPVHLGSTPLSVRAAIDRFDFEPGDGVLLNDPYEGGTHLPDFTLVTPVFLRGERRPRFFAANRAHHADVGGASPGSMGLAREIFAEGIRVPPVKWLRRGRVDPDLESLILRNVRTPAERAGDFAAQAAANLLGCRRLASLASRYGPARLSSAAAALLDHAERAVRAAIRAIPRGVFRFEDRLDDDGISARPIPIRVAIQRRGSDLFVDFAGSSPQVEGPLNANFAVTLSCVFYVLRCLLPPDTPTNAGCLRPVHVSAPSASVVNASPPAAVSGGNVETSQRIVDALLGALARALPGRIPAASQGTMNNLAFGGRDPRIGAAFTHYETVAGGMGARPGRDGLSGVHTHMTNTRNTPVEAIESLYPVRVERTTLRRGSGGAGRFRGGDGVERAIRFLVPCEVSLLGERRRFAPWGLAGGRPAARGEDLREVGGVETPLPSKTTVRVAAGERVLVRTPGGGGFGRPARRS